MQWAIRLVETLGYPGIVIIVALENVFPPVPSEIILPFAGLLAKHSHLTLVGLLVATTIGSVLGAMGLYGMGKILGRERVYSLTTRYGRFLGLPEERVKRAERWFRRYGGWALFIGGVTPTSRSIVSVPAGLVGMPLPSFLAFTAVGSLLWNGLLVVAGGAAKTLWVWMRTWAGARNSILLLLISASTIASGVLWFRLIKVKGVYQQRI